MGVVTALNCRMTEMPAQDIEGCITQNSQEVGVPSRPMGTVYDLSDVQGALFLWESSDGPDTRGERNTLMGKRRGPAGLGALNQTLNMKGPSRPKFPELRSGHI